MKNLKFTVNSWIFGNIPFTELARRAHEIGLDGLEIDGEPPKVDVPLMRETMAKYNLTAISICGTFGTHDRAFNHSDPAMREQAIAYGKGLVDLAVALDTDKVLVVPSRVDQLTPYDTKETDWNHAVESLRQVAQYAKEQGNITIMLECVNKYEVNMVYSLADGIRMAKDIGTGNVGLVGDTFHMQMEEAQGIPAAIRNAGDQWLTHLHLGDSNRELPGLGFRDWREVFQALQDIDFTGAVSFEPVPNHLSFQDIAQGKLDNDVLQAQMTTSIQMLKAMMVGIQ